MEGASVCLRLPRPLATGWLSTRQSLLSLPTRVEGAAESIEFRSGRRTREDDVGGEERKGAKFCQFRLKCNPRDFLCSLPPYVSAFDDSILSLSARRLCRNSASPPPYIPSSPCTDLENLLLAAPPFRSPCFFSIQWSREIFKRWIPTFSQRRPI